MITVDISVFENGGSDVAIFSLPIAYARIVMENVTSLDLIFVDGQEPAAPPSEHIALIEAATAELTRVLNED